MSKRKGQRRKKRRKSARAFRAPADRSPASLLSALAVILNACADSGLRVKFSHGGVVTREGYVLPLKGGRWTARSLTYDPLSPAEDPDGDGMDE